MNTIRARRGLIGLLAVFLLTTALSVAARAQTTPIQVVKSATDRMMQALNANRERIKNDRAYIYQLVNKILVPHVDFREMSSRVLATSWRDVSPRQQAAFVEAFKTLVIRTYSESLRAFTNQRVKILEQRRSRANKSLVEIRTEITQPNGPSIPVNYRLMQEDNVWRVYDMKVEGVSLVGNFRAQFRGKIRELGIDGLIQQIQLENKQP